MARTAALGALAGVVLTWSWLRLEHGTTTGSLLLWTALVGVVPALLPHRPLRLAAVPPAMIAGLYYAFDTARPRVVRERIVDGFYRFYEVALPFPAAEQPLTHALVVIAILGFTLATSLAIAERRAVLAAGLLVAGAAWPATLLTSSNTVARGAVVLVAALAIVGGLSATPRLRQAGIASALVVAAAVAAAGIPAVAKGAFVGWETWEPKRADLPVSVRYVWQTTYGPLKWPEKKTTVFTVEAPPISRYWRATTLDVFNGGFWLEQRLPVQPEPVVDPLLPAEALDPERQYEARVQVRALQDIRLIGASIPVRYDVGDLGPVMYQTNGSAYLEDGVPQGAEYTAWSYAVRPAPRRLARSRPIYPPLLDEYVVVEERTEPSTAPPFGAPEREAEMRALFEENYGIRRYRPLYEHALDVAGDAPTPYAAAVALESWFRDSDIFTYDQEPRYRGQAPVLVEFVSSNRRGYCQQFAGAMALMLRYLGIPARVAAGFTSGSYNQEARRWTVTDHDAHLWVEVWFRGFGWVPFDPTPGRGQLDGAYSTASINFDAAAVAAALAAATPGASSFTLETGQFEGVNRPDRGQTRDVPGDIGGATAAAPSPSLLRLLALVAAALVATIALVKLVLRRARYLTRDPRRVAAACRRELADFLRDQRVDVPESATVAELGAILSDEAGVDAEASVRAVDTARYGPPGDAAAAARRARRELRRAERLFRRRLSTWERTRGLVSLRSLGLTGS